MRNSAWMLVLLSACAAAQTLRLRHGGPQSVYHITQISTGTPAVVTVKNRVSWQQQHDFVNGDVVYIQFVPGCAEANGHRKVVNANQSQGTFGITDLNDNPVTCSYPFVGGYESAMVGKVANYELRTTRPRVFLPGSGPLLERSKDPDGSGPQVAPVVVENDYPWQAMLNKYAGRITPGCDGRTPSLCPNEESTLDMGDGSGRWGYAAHAAAYIWFADNSRTGYLNLARYLINHMERAMLVNTAGARPGFGFPCDSTADSCGWGSGCDWLSIGMWHYALAYDLIRDQLTSEERENFAKKMLNGWGGEHDCSNQLQKQSGVANLTQGSKTVTGRGFSVYQSGDGVYFKTGGWGQYGRWGIVQSVASDSEMTVNFIINTSKTASSDITVSGVDHYKVMPWDETRCGAAFLAGGQGKAYNVGWAVIGRAITTLATGIDAEQTTITVTNPGGFPAPPFDVLIDNEVLKVTAVNGTQWTVVRGQLYTTPAPHASGRAVEYSSQTSGASFALVGPRAFAGEWYHNLTAQKAVGFLVAAFVLAGDDPRAAAYAERMWNWYYDTIYVTNKEYWTGPNQGGLQNAGYQFGRWQANHILVGLAGRNSFQNGSIDVLEPYFWRGLITLFLWTPPGGPTHWGSMPIDPALKGQHGPKMVGWGAAAATLAPGVEAQYFQYYYRNLWGGLNASLDGAHSVLMAAYSPANAAQRDFRDELPPWSFHTDTDFNPEAYYGLLVSKKDWSESSGMLVANAGWQWPSDHTVDQGMYYPGGYTIFKGSKILFGWDNSYGIGGDYNTTPWFRLFAGATKSVIHPPWTTMSGGGMKNVIDRKHGDAVYVYARGNFKEAWQASAGVLRHNRHFLHLKTEPEYVVIYDEAEMNAAKTVHSYLQYFHRYDSAQSFTASEDYRNIRFVKPTGDGATLSTSVFFPDSQAPTATYTQTSNVHKVTFAWSSTATASMITVHRVASGVADRMPSAQLLSGVDSRSVGVEVLDSEYPVAFVFAKDGRDRSECAFRISFGQMGRIIVTGLSPGNYRVYRNGVEVGSSVFVVAPGDGTLSLEGIQGDYLVSAVPPASLAVEPTALHFDYAAGQQPPSAQGFRALCTGGTCTVTIEEACSWVTVTPLSGLAPAEFTVGVDVEGLEAGRHTCTIWVNAAALNSPQRVMVTLDVASLPEEPPAPSVVVERAGATTRNLVVRYGKLGLKTTESCRVELSNSPNWEQVLEAIEDAGGPARRVAVLGNSSALQPATEYFVRAICGTASQTVRMFTRAAPVSTERGVRFRIRPAWTSGASQIRLDYGQTAELNQSVTVSCAVGWCDFELRVPSDRLLYFRYTYLDGEGRELTRSAKQVMAVP